MQRIKIPRFADPRYAAAKRLDYDGYVPAEALERLRGAVAELEGDAGARLSFGVDLQGVTVIEGVADAEVKLVCDRCGGTFGLKLRAPIRCTPDAEKVAELGLEDSYDYAELDETGETDLYRLVEDELLLALPLSPRHADADCPEKRREWVAGEFPEERAENPFAVLEKLKKE